MSSRLILITQIGKQRVVLSRIDDGIVQTRRQSLFEFKFCLAFDLSFDEVESFCLLHAW